MKLAIIPIGLALLLCAAGANAQMYKWVDAKGVVHYTDTPPPDKKAAEVKASGGAATEAALPYELAAAVRTAPVTLYTASSCNACDMGRKLLQTRGIPFSEKTVASDDDLARLKEAGSDGQLPLLLVGRSKLVGFEAGAWNGALSNAAYPAQRMLPANYKQAAAVAAAPPRGPSPEMLAREKARAAAAEAAAARAQVRAEARAKKQTQDAPPTIQF